jgi:DNA-binding transcriptional regulator YiaG
VTLLSKLDAAGMTPDAIAAALNVSPRSIFRWGHRESTPQPSHLERLRELSERGNADESSVGSKG